MRFADSLRPRSLWQWLAGIALACLVWLVLVPLWDLDPPPFHGLGEIGCGQIGQRLVVPKRSADPIQMVLGPVGRT